MGGYDLDKIKIKLNQYINSSSVNLLIGAGFSLPSFPSMVEIKEIFKEIINGLYNKATISQLCLKFNEKGINNFLINDEVFIEDSLKDLYSFFEKNINTDNIKSILSELNSNINFEEILYKNNIENLINKENNKLSDCFVYLFFKIYQLTKVKVEYSKNLKKIEELIKWLLNKNQLYTKKIQKQQLIYLLQIMILLLKKL